MRILVTGDADFTCTTLIRQLVGHNAHQALCCVKLTYVGCLSNSESVPDNRRYDQCHPIDPTRIKGKLGRRPCKTLQPRPRSTVGPYIDNKAWWRRNPIEHPADQRCGLAA